MNLAELDAEGLLARHDTKFLVPETHLPCLLAKLKPLCRILDIAGRRSFGYDSLYLDTPDRALFRAHHQGKVKRSKARWRVYRDTGACFFEVKYKASAGMALEIRITLMAHDHSAKFTIDTLVEMLSRLGKPVSLAVQ